MDSKTTLEPGLVSILNGVDLSKLIPLFEKHSVNLEMFFSLTDDDLRTIGVESANERELILNIRNKLQKSNQTDEDLTMGPEEVLEVIKNSRNQIHAIDVATCFVYSKFKNEKLVDFLVNGDKPVSSAIQMLCNRVQKQNNELIFQIDEVLKNLDFNQKQNEGSSRKKVFYGFSCCTAVILISVIAFLKFKKN